MPTTPPLHEFAMRYPAFESVLPSRVELALADAAASLTTTLPERIWRTAVMLKAAHELTLGGYGDGVEATLAAKGLGGFTSVSDGVVTASRPAAAASRREGGYAGSTYGQALANLLRHSLPPAMVGGGSYGAVLGSPNHPVLRRD